MRDVPLLREVARLNREQEEWRSRTLNLIASENVLSPAARALLDGDFHHRYAEGHPGARYYEGTRYIDIIEEKTRLLVQEIFAADRADVRLPSGTTCNEAVFSALVPRDGVACSHGVAGGGHISHARIGALGKHAARILELPRGPDGFHLDVPAAKDLIRKERPSLVVLGRSLFLFPEPISDLRQVCDDSGTRIVYDGSHVLGLIAGGQFQDPLREGADLITASTHKTFFGPQRGIVVARGKDDAFWKPIDRAVFPGVTSNHHLFTLPALYATCLEVKEFGREYAKAVVANARALARSLDRRGLVVAAAGIGYTCSHQVAVDAGEFGGGRAAAGRLAASGIITNMNLLPTEPQGNARNPRGLRLGVQEMTRFGMDEAAMERIASLIQECLAKGRDVSGETRRMREEFPKIRYGYGVADLGGEAAGVPLKASASQG
ncbi:MAG: serine hydroxymethyltransferase [Planctomycetaceae bacterium]